jgi:hypothetical protein
MSFWKDSAVPLLASSTSGIFARLTCHPLDTCKARLQIQGSGASPKYKNLLDTLLQTYRVEGLRGLYRGFGVTIVGSAPATCMYLTSYDVAKDMLNSSVFAENQFLSHFSAGMIAETFSCVLWVPIDVTKERLQIQEKAGKGVPTTNYKGSIDAVHTILRTEGFRGIYKGYGATVASFGPFSAFYFMFYEQIKSTSINLYYGTNSDKIRDPPFWLHLINSSTASMLASFVTNPLDLVKLRLQVQRGSGSSVTHTWGEYEGMLDGLRQITIKEGFNGLFRGVGARMAFHGPSIAITISCYEKLKVWWEDVLGMV